MLAASGRRRPPMTTADHEALRRGLRAIGLDPEYWGHDDTSAMWSWGYTVARMVQAAQQREARGR
jgi:hypothetical protein